MGIEGLSDQRRLPRLMKIRLGVKATSQSGAPYPKEVDYFVLKQEDFVSPELFKEVVDVYGEKPKALKMMSPFEVDSANPGSGDELIYNLYNRIYGSGAALKCKGTGGSAAKPGTAMSTDKALADRVGQQTGVAPVAVDGGWELKCLGRDCCKYVGEGHDGKDAPGGQAACRMLLVFRAFLLHSTDDPMSPDYCRPFGIAEIASTSYNTALDIRSGLAMLEVYAKRTAAVPFWLHRHPRQTNHDGKRQVHYTCMVSFTAKEIQQAGLTKPSEIFLPAALRQELKALGEPDFDSVRDLFAAPEKRLAAPADPTPPPTPLNGAGTDRDEVVAEAENEAAEVIEGELVGADGQPKADEEDVDPDDLPPMDERSEQRYLTQAERDELKTLCGGREDPANAKSPFKAEALQRLHELASNAHAVIGTKPEKSLLGSLQVRHGRWIREQLTIEAQEGAA